MELLDGTAATVGAELRLPFLARRLAMPVAVAAEAKVLLPEPRLMVVVMVEIQQAGPLVQPTAVAVEAVRGVVGTLAAVAAQAL
jgi:hypothetical protein